MTKQLARKHATLERLVDRKQVLNLNYAVDVERIDNRIDELKIDIELIEGRIDQRQVNRLKTLHVRQAKLTEQLGMFPDEVKEAAGVA